MSPKVRQILYVIGLVAFALLTVLSTFKVIDEHTAASVSAALTAILGVFGVTVSGTAAYNVTKQVNAGKFGDPPSPADQVVAGINAAVHQAQTARAEVDRIKDAVLTAAQDTPVLGPLAQQALDALDLPDRLA
jgi:hypothetical protein